MNNSVRERRPKEASSATQPQAASSSAIHLRKPDDSRLIWQYILVGALITASIIATYVYLSSVSINSIFFRYGLPSDPAWKQNDLLRNKISRIDVRLKGPEAIAIGPNGSIYTGLSNGVIIRIDEYNNVEKIIQVGEEMDERICDFVRSGHVAEKKCGRPFGMRFKPNTNFLYVADSFYGIVRVDVVKKTKTIVLSANDTRLGSKPLRSTEDIDLDGDNIYFVDSSYKHNINEIIQDVTHSFPGGRLFCYNERKDRLDLLADGLFYPNGVQLTPNGDALFVNEFSMARIIKIYLADAMKGKREVFTELPGLSEAIRLSNRDTLLVPFVAVFPVSPSISSYLGGFPFLRPIVGFFLNPKEVMQMWPRYGLVAEFDMNGRVLRTWHDPTGQQVSHVTNAVVQGDKLLLGSFTNDFITVASYK